MRRKRRGMLLKGGVKGMLLKGEVNKKRRKHPKTNARGMLRMQGRMVVMMMEIINL